jgi:uncharacterized membrane protein YeaQ/YmgE (transglycosylase-associated protein family)
MLNPGRRRLAPAGDLGDTNGGHVMGILSWILLGLIVGVLAKWIMPGDDPGGTIITILLGIAGAFVGGFLATLIGLGTVDGFNVGSLLIAIGGSLLLLWVYRKMRTNRVT